MERLGQSLWFAGDLLRIRSSTRVVIHGDLAEAVDGTLQGEEVQVEERYVEAGQMHLGVGFTPFSSFFS